MNRLPAFIRRYIEHSPALQKALANASWLFADSIMRMGLGLLVGVWMARYLGPEQFGLFNYAAAFVALFGAIAAMGLNGIVVRDLVREPETANITLGTAFVLQLIGGLLAFGLALLAISIARPEDGLAKGMVAIFGFVLVFKATETVKYWFESQTCSKYTIWVGNAAFLAFAGVKVALILCKAPLIAFVWAVFAEALLVAVMLLGIYAWRGSHLLGLCVSIHRAKTLLKESWPFILSSLAIMAYMRIDQIMLGQMLGDEVVGIYSVAVRISEVWYFMPTAIVASVFPYIIEGKKKSEALYYQRLQKLYDVMVLVSLSVAVPLTFLSEWVVSSLFGLAYQQAGAVLAIHIWTGLFVALSFSSGRWFINEGYSFLAFKRNLMGLILNIALNIYLIPLYGPIGAAWATLISYFVASYVSDAFSRETRIVFMQKTRSLFFINLILKDKR